MRLISILLATAAMFVASSSGAVELVLVGTSASGAVSVTPGTNVTIELKMTNTGATDGIFGLGASAHGYDAGLSFLSGRGVRRYALDTDTFLSNLAGTSSGGSGNALQRVLAESAIGANGPRVQLGLSAAVTGSAYAPGSLVEAGLEGAGTPMFRLTFQVLANALPGTYDILFDSTYQGDLINLDPAANPNVAEIAGTVFHVTVVPEPGTALLMGLGLAGLAAAGRRS